MKVAGYVSKPDEDGDIVLGKLELDITENPEQAILDVLGALSNGYVLNLFPDDIKDQYSIEWEDEVVSFEFEQTLDVLHFTMNELSANLDNVEVSEDEG